MLICYLDKNNTKQNVNKFKPMDIVKTQTIVCSNVIKLNGYSYMN